MVFSCIQKNSKGYWVHTNEGVHKLCTPSSKATRNEWCMTLHELSNHDHEDNAWAAFMAKYST
jgi:hypothetical protein